MVRVSQGFGPPFSSRYKAWVANFVLPGRRQWLHTISLNRGFSPLEHTISEFVLMDYGWIERTGLFLLGAAMLALGIVWFRRLGDKTNRLFHLSGLILVLLGLCFL